MANACKRSSSISLVLRSGLGVEERERDVPGDARVLGVDLPAAVGVDMPPARSGENGAGLAGGVEE